MRYFKSTSDVYEQVRSQFNAAYGYPNQDTKTVTAIPPASEAPTDEQGFVYLAASNDECEYQAIAAALPQLLSSGAVEEIDEATYRAALQETTLP